MENLVYSSCFLYSLHLKEMLYKGRCDNHFRPVKKIYDIRALGNRLRKSFFQENDQPFWPKGQKCIIIIY